jgi:AcrR family transcriptional regulator
MKKHSSLLSQSSTATQPEQARKIEILERITHLFAVGGSEQLSMRSLAASVGVASSVLYYYFANKEELLTAMYDHNNRILGQERARLPEAATAREKLENCISFQFAHAERVVAVLKYYFAFRQDFAQHPDRTLPPKATQHIDEVLDFGIAAGAYAPRSRSDAKVITHIINGYLLEIYPLQLSNKERTEITQQIADFIERSVRAEHSLLPTDKQKHKNHL